jgi:hypothetical protein
LSVLLLFVFLFLQNILQRHFGKKSINKDGLCEEANNFLDYTIWKYNPWVINPYIDKNYFVECSEEKERQIGVKHSIKNLEKIKKKKEHKIILKKGQDGFIFYVVKIGCANEFFLILVLEEKTYELVFLITFSQNSMEITHILKI